MAAPQDELAESLDRPIFVVAPPQAGTHWVAHALARSPDVHALGLAGQRAIEIEDSATEPKSREPSDRLTAADATDSRSRRLRAALRRLLPRAAVTGEGGRRLIDATPRNALRIPFLDVVFPSARFVFVYREPRDTLESMAHAWRCGRYATYPDLAGWTGDPWSLVLIPGWRRLAGETLEEIVVAQWTATMEILLDDLEALPSDRWSVVDYRGLELRPHAELERLSRFLGIESPPGRPPTPDGYVESPTTWLFEGGDPIAPGHCAALEAAERAYGLIAKPLTRRPRRSPDAASPLRSVYSAGARQVLERLGCSLLLTAPASDRLVCIRRDGARLNTHFLRHATPRAVAQAGRRLAVASDACVTAYVDRPEARTDAGSDEDAAHFVPDGRWALEADRVEDLTFAGPRILLATAGLGCVELADDHRLRPIWRPPAGQRLTGVAIVGDHLAYATVDAGCVVDIASGEIVAGDLSDPCAPRWHEGQLWLLESGRRRLCEIEIATGARRAAAELPGVPNGARLGGGRGRGLPLSGPVR